jgi:hypothetical protein
MLAAVLKRAPSTKGILVVPDNEQILSALLLTSTLANSDDPRISGQAIKLLREISTTFDHPHAASEDVYPFIRQYKFCRAEAEHGRHVNRCVDFLSRCERDYPGIDARRMRKYYRSANTGTIRAQLGKLTNPRSRDLHTQKITASIIELVEADSGRFSGP